MKKYYYCEDCDEIFAEDNAGAKRTEWGYGDKEFYSCPTCGSIDLLDADKCVICGEPIPPDSVKICTECAETLHKEWVNFVEKVMDRRLKENNGLSADYLDCEQAALDFLDEVGII